MEMTRAEHLRWAKDRALEYADMGDASQTLSSMASDLNKHPETAGHAGIKLGFMELMTGGLRTPHALRRWVEGFN